MAASAGPPGLRRRTSLVQRDLSLLSLTTDKLDRTGSGQVLAPNDAGAYARLELAARSQKLTAEEEARDVDVCVQAIDVEIAKIGRNVFKEYCGIRVAPPNEFYFPCAAAMLLCGEDAVSWNALKRLLQQNSCMILKERIRDFRPESLTPERYVHVNDFVRKHWEHLNYKKVAAVCEPLAPVADWVKFQLKRFDLHETMRHNEEKRRSRKSVAARASLRRLSSINNFTVAEKTLDAIAESSEPTDKGRATGGTSGTLPPGFVRHSTVPAGSRPGSSLSATAPPMVNATRGSGGGGGGQSHALKNIRQAASSNGRKSAATTSNRGSGSGFGSAATIAGIVAAKRAGRKLRMNYRRVPATVAEGDEAASASAKTQRSGGDVAGVGGKRASSYFGMYNS